MHHYESLIAKYNLTITPGHYGFDAPKTWFNLIENLICKLIELGWNREVQQVKSKFGGLRFYIPLSTPAMDLEIIKAESESFNICTKCGGKMPCHQRV
jgi:hypothetical protein